MLVLLVSACQPGRKRAYGYLRLGELAEQTAAERYMPEKNLMLRRDGAGFFVMSTLCTYDLSPLVRLPDGSFASEYSKSRYDGEGRVSSGPAKANLPYYELVLAPGVYGGVPDTLYVKIGEEVPREWRLKVIERAGSPAGGGAASPG